MENTSVQKYEEMIGCLPIQMRVAYEMNTNPMQGKCLRSVLDKYKTAKGVIDFIENSVSSILTDGAMFVIIGLSLFFMVKIFVANSAAIIFPVVLTSIMITGLVTTIVSKHLNNKFAPILTESGAILQKFEKDIQGLFCHKKGLIDPERVSGPVLEIQLVSMAETVLRKEADYQYAKSLSTAPVQVMLMACQYDIQAHEHFETMWNSAKLFGVTKRTKESIFNQAKASVQAKLPTKDWDKLHD